MLKTEILTIVDRSGSMQRLHEATISGLNRFIREQKEAGGECRHTLVEFDDIVNTVYAAKDLYEVEEFNASHLVPRGSTSLLDAIGQTLETHSKRIIAEKWAELVIVDITTDGQENTSKSYTADRIKGMIQMSQNLGWQFIFQAANQDAFATASNLGVAKGGVSNYSADAAGTAAVYGGKFAYVNNMRSVGASASMESLVGELDNRTLDTK